MRAFFRGSQVLLLISACWMLFIGVLIVIDVAGRNLFSAPLIGTPEIVAVSLVCIAFIQITYAILSASMLRVTVFEDAAPKGVRVVLGKIQMLCGAGVFAALTIGCWWLLVDSWQSGEYTGEGSFPISLIPARVIVFVGCIAATIAYLARLAGVGFRDIHLAKATEV